MGIQVLQGGLPVGDSLGKHKRGRVVFNCNLLVVQVCWITWKVRWIHVVSAVVHAYDYLQKVFTGEEKFLFLWVWVLTYEMAGIPFLHHKFYGGFSESVGFQIRYVWTEVGLSVKLGEWILQ